MYIREIEIENIKIESFTIKHSELVKDFFCDNEYIDNYIHNEALTDRRTKTYLFIYHDKLLGFFSISAKGISVDNSPKKPYNLPAIEISFFALDKKYHHMYYDERSEEELDKFYLSDILFVLSTKFIKNEIATRVGSMFVTLYSVPRAEDLYKRNDFINFEPVMLAENKNKLEGCIPLYAKINDIE